MSYKSIYPSAFKSSIIHHFIALRERGVQILAKEEEKKGKKSCRTKPPHL